MRPTTDIFDEYAKIALEQGLIKHAQKKEETKRTEQNNLEMLYGLKPDMLKGMEYKHNIIEIAHPNSVIFSPAHDKLNGLIENNNEQQSIILHILKQKNNGSLHKQKYAEAFKDLSLSLTKIANHVDNINDEKLTALADVCLEQTQDHFKKKAWIAPIFKFLAPHIWTAAKFGFGLFAGNALLSQFKGPAHQSLEASNSELTKTMSDIIEEEHSRLWGQTFTDEFKEKLRTFKNTKNTVDTHYTELKNAAEKIPAPTTEEEYETIAKDSATKSKLEDLSKKYNSFKKESYDFIQELEAFKKEMTTNASKYVKETGWLTKQLQDIPLVGKKFGPLSTLLEQVEAYEISIKTVVSSLEKTLTEVSDLKRKVKQQKTEAPKDFFAQTKPSESSSLLSSIPGLDSILKKKEELENKTSKIDSLKQKVNSSSRISNVEKQETLKKLDAKQNAVEKQLAQYKEYLDKARKEQEDKRFKSTEV